MTRWLAALVLVAGCGAVDVAGAPPGEFKGKLFVMWVGETEGPLGDGKFVFVPADDPLRLERRRPGATVEVIQPGMMYTDGGSIPPIAAAFKGFSPWGYAPAYMVHDWLFVAKRCWEDDQGTPEEAAAAKMPFPETAEVAAEAINTLIAQKKVKPNDVAPEVISRIVAGPISRQLWEKPGACERVSEAHKAEVFRARPELLGLRKTRELGAGPKATVVGVVEFGEE